MINDTLLLSGLYVGNIPPKPQRGCSSKQEAPAPPLLNLSLRIRTTHLLHQSTWNRRNGPVSAPCAKKFAHVVAQDKSESDFVIERKYVKQYCDC